MRRYKDMTSDEKNVVKQHIQLYGGLLLIFVVIAVFLRIYNTRLIQGDGILPTPRKAVDPIGVTYYAQDDPRWAGDALGQTGYTMQEEGSLFAAATASQWIPASSTACSWKTIFTSTMARLPI